MHLNLLMPFESSLALKYRKSLSFGTHFETINFTINALFLGQAQNLPLTQNDGTASTDSSSKKWTIENASMTFS